MSIKLRQNFVCEYEDGREDIEYINIEYKNQDVLDAHDGDFWDEVCYKANDILAKRPGKPMVTDESGEIEDFLPADAVCEMYFDQ